MDTKEAKVYVAILIAAGVLGIILVYFIITIIRQQKKNLVLHKEKIQAEINTLETERKRIAADLHDDLGPLLSAVKLQINSLNSEDKEDAEIIDKSNSQIDVILHRVREISNDLMPHVLLRKGLVAAIKEYVDDLKESHILQVNFDSPAIVIPSKETEVHLYRVVKEIIHNTIKHAHATLLELKLYKENNKLILYARDDGKGFEYDQVIKNSRGLGLSNLASRIEILKGELFIESKPGKGTAYTIEIPL